MWTPILNIHIPRRSRPFYLFKLRKIASRHSLCGASFRLSSVQKENAKPAARLFSAPDRLRLFVSRKAGFRDKVLTPKTNWAQNAARKREKFDNAVWFIAMFAIKKSDASENVETLKGENFMHRGNFIRFCFEKKRESRKNMFFLNRNISLLRHKQLNTLTINFQHFNFNLLSSVYVYVLLSPQEHNLITHPSDH